jgi:hypothetical protein
VYVFGASWQTLGVHATADVEIELALHGPSEAVNLEQVSSFPLNYEHVFGPKTQPVPSVIQSLSS